MARAWRRTLLAAVATALLGSAYALGTLAWAADEQAEEEPAHEASEGQPDQASKGGKKRQDPAEAQRAIEAALKQVQAGRPEQALPGLTATLSGGNLPPAIMAKAFYVRGMAFRAQRRPAQAISDLNSALWLRGGLGGEDRDGAVRERAAAYADAGLGDQGEVAVSAASPKAASGSWLSGLFSGPSPSLFGSSGSSEPPRPPPAAAPPPAPAAVSPAATAPTAVAGAWNSTTQTQAPRPPAPAAPPPRAEPPPPRAAPAAARMEGRYQVQLGALRTEAEARALVAKAKREAALASLEPAIDHAVIGNFGAFYRVRFGPFASTQDAQGVCARLQGSGFDCMPVGP
jgi:cell division septation protein DedD